MTRAMHKALRNTPSLLPALGAAAALVLAPACAPAQTNLLPLPFGSVIAGQAPGGSTTACTTTLPTAAGVTVPGDGCPASQATLNGAYGVAVDDYGNLYFGDYNTYALRVVYMGGAALAAALQAANPTHTFTPQVGYVYTLAGSRSATLASTQGPTGKAYYCNGAGSGTIGLSSNADGCPATYGYLKPRSPFIDKDGNVLFTSSSGSAPVRVVYVGGTQMASLITTLNPGTTPQPGFIYSIIKSSSNEYAGDGLLATNSGVHMYAERDVAEDSAGNIYVSDGTNSFTAPSYASNNNIRRVDGVTGIISTYAGSPASGTYACAQGSTSGCAGVYSGDGGPATSATFDSPYSIFFDKNDNLYITDYNDARLRVVYKAGSVPGLSNLTAGDVYTVAGGGATSATAANSHVAATSLSFGYVYTAGIDAGGNLWLIDGKTYLLWRIDANTGIADYMGGGHAQYSAAGLPCGSGAKPVTTDKLGDGCPATQLSITPNGRISFDKYGNFYVIDSANNLLRKFSYNTQFPNTAAGSSTSQPLAFQVLTTPTVTTESFTLQGSATSEFADAGNDSCTLGVALTAGTTCTFNVSFTPALAGLRQGSLTLTGAAGGLVTDLLTGTGVAANVSVDPASTTTLGSNYSVSGVGVDLNGNVYFSDATSGSVLKSSAGGTPTVLFTGLSQPAQVAVDGAGNVYVADSGNNRIAETSAAGGTVTSLGTGLSKPQGVAVDAVGNVYVADTGNNRIVRISPLGGETALDISGLSSPTQLAFDAAGDLFIADTGNNRVVEQPASSEALAVNLGTATVTPQGVAVDAAGDLYIADSASGQVLSFAPGSTNPDALVTGLTGPHGLAVDAEGSLYIADASATGAIVADRFNPTTSFPNTNVNTTNSTQINTTNTGNASLLYNGSTLTTATGSTADFSVAAAGSNGCALNTAIAPAQNCALIATFAPLARGSETETASFVTNAPNGAAAVLTGVGVQLVSTTTTVAVTAPTTPTISYSQSVTVTATIAASGNAGAAPSGTVTFTVDGKKQTPQTLPASNTLSLTQSLAVGAHSICASYSGDSNYASSSNCANFTVQQAATTTALTITPTAQGTLPALTFTATVSSTTATGETGTVTFYSGTTALNTVPVSNGSASFTQQGVTFATYSFTAVYSGDANFAGSTSAAVAPKSDFLAIPLSSTVAIPAGAVATITFDITGLYNYTGTVSASCSGLPANSLCRYSPSSLTFPGSTPTQVLSIYIYTDMNPSTAGIGNSARRGVWLTLAAAALACFALRRRRMALHALAALVLGAALFSISGCGGTSTTANQYLTPQGASTITVTLTDSSGNQHAFPFTFTVNPPAPLP